MDLQTFEVPKHWPKDARNFSRKAISEIQELKAALKEALSEIISLIV